MRFSQPHSRRTASKHSALRYSTTAQRPHNTCTSKCERSHSTTRTNHNQSASRSDRSEEKRVNRSEADRAAEWEQRVSVECRRRRRRSAPARRSSPLYARWPRATAGATRRASWARGRSGGCRALASPGGSASGTCRPGSRTSSASTGARHDRRPNCTRLDPTAPNRTEPKRTTGALAAALARAHLSTPLIDYRAAPIDRLSTIDYRRVRADHSGEQHNSDELRFEERADARNRS